MKQTNLKKSESKREAPGRTGNGRQSIRTGPRNRGKRDNAGHADEPYRQLVQNVNSIILRWRRDGTIIFMNDYGLSFFGYTEAEILGKSVIGTIVPAMETEGRDLADLMHAIFDNPEKYAQHINQNLCRDGHRVWISWTNRARRNASGRATEMFSVGQDITEKRQMESQLQIQASLLDTVPSSITVHDLNGKFLYVNQKTLDYHAYTGEEYMSLNLREIDTPESARLIGKRMGFLKRKGEASFEVTHFRKDGSLLPLLVNARMAKWEDQQVVLSVASDLTEQKRVETEIKRTNSLLEAIREAQSIVITDADPRPAFEILLNALVSLTESRCGFLDEVLRDGAGVPYKLNLALTDISWSGESEELYEKIRMRKLAFRNLQNLAGLPVVTGKPVIANEVPQDRRAGGLPPGHPSLSTYMGLPLYYGGQLVGVAGVANRTEGYDDGMTRFLEPFLSACAGIIHAVGQKKKEKETAERLQMNRMQLMESNRILSAILESTHIMTVLLDRRFNFVWVNRAYAETCGYEPGYFKGKNHFTLYPHDENRAIFQKVVDSGEPFFAAAKPFVFPDQPQRGVTFWDWSLIPIKDDVGMVTLLVFTLIDVTEKIRQEEDLRLKSLVLDQIQDHVTITDLTGRITYVNQAQSNNLDRTKSELLGEPVTIFGEDGRRGATQQEIVENTLRNGHWIGTVVNYGADGRELILDCRTQVVYAADNRPVALSGIARDITERTRLEEAMQKKLIALTKPLGNAATVTIDDLIGIAELQKIQDEFSRAFNVASIITNPDGTPLTQPSNFTRLCSEIIRGTEKGRANCQKSDATLGRYHPEGPVVAPCLSCGLWDAGTSIMLGGKSVAIWLIGQVRDETQTEEGMRAYAHSIDIDEERFVEAFREVPTMARADFQRIADLLFTLANKLSDMAYQNVQQARFISERIQAEKALRESEKNLLSLQNAINESVCLFDRQGIVIAANATFAARLGMFPEDCVGQSIFSLIPPEIAAKRRIHVEEVLQTGKPLQFEDQRQGRWLYHSLVPILDHSGTVSRIAVFAVDTTARRLLEERVRRSEKMEALGTMAGGVAHDLNNVLGVVIAFSELLKEKVDPAGPLWGYVTHIMENSDRAALIVEDLLTLARRGVHVDQVLNLNTVVEACRGYPEFERLLITHPEIGIRVSLAPDLLNMKGSPVHLSKTVMNLVLNAVEAIHGLGEVLIRTESVYLDRPVGGYDEVRSGEYAVLTVTDTGEGISENDLKRIFEPFYTKKVMGKSGTGLGLSVVWGTVKDHGGYIDVQSEVGRGSTFTLYFPVVREEVPGREATVSSFSHMGQGELILVVDDVADQRAVAELLLTRLGYRVVMVSGGDEALAYLRGEGADLVILDMIMDPGMDGLETYRRILEIRPDQKAIIVSGFSETERVREALSLGVGAYVKKPYVMEKLGLAIRKELERKR